MVKYKIFLFSFFILIIPASICAQTTLKFDPILQVIQKGYADGNSIKDVAPHLNFFKYTGDFYKDSLLYFRGISKWYTDYPQEAELFFKQIISRQEFSKLMNAHYFSVQQEQEILFQKYMKIIDEKGYVDDISIIAPHMPAYGSLPEKKQEWIDKYPYEYKALLYNEKKKPNLTEDENTSKQKLMWIKENDSVRYKQINFNK